MTSTTADFLILAIITLLQMIVAFLVTFSLYMMLAISDYTGGIDKFAGLMVIQPVLGAIFAVLTVVICFIIGLPIRVISTVRHWWIARTFVPVLGIAFGLILLILSYLSPWRGSVSEIADGFELQQEIPNLTLVLSGWFATTFFILHTFPPFSSILSFKKRITSSDKQTTSSPVNDQI
ncbi:MAG: hypothetical protein ACOYXT_25450 [Bacteroidota bacterium]